jgi:hypothetical protein
LALELHTAIDIAAPPERVWEVLTDFARYPDWNTFLQWVHGEPVVGQHLRMYIVSGRNRMRFKTRVLAADPARELRWIGHLVVPGLFDGEHRFRMTPRDGGTHFEQDEEFHGILVPLLARTLQTDAKRSFEQMNEALKLRAES